MFIHQKKHVYLFGLLEFQKGRLFVLHHDLKKTISVRVGLHPPESISVSIKWKLCSSWWDSWDYLPAPSKGWCLNPKGLLSGTLYHPFGTPWGVQVYCPLWEGRFSSWNLLLASFGESHKVGEITPLNSCLDEITSPIYERKDRETHQIIKTALLVVWLGYCWMSDMISFSVFQIGILIWVFEAHKRHCGIPCWGYPCRFSHLKFFGSPLWAKKKMFRILNPKKIHGFGKGTLYQWLFLVPLIGGR